MQSQEDGLDVSAMCADLSSLNANVAFRSPDTIRYKDGDRSLSRRCCRTPPGQIALACLPKRSLVMLSIPGTSKVSHLEENVAAANIVQSDEEFAELDRAGRGP
jgi:aryl-alcohol dehydrogenase-like predicted oxidoreductase